MSEAQSIEGLLKIIENGLRNREELLKKAQEIKTLFWKLDEAWNSVLNFLDLAEKIAKQEGDKDFQRLIWAIREARKPEAVSVLAERLKSLGYGAPESVQKALENSLFRIMELARLGKREEVYYALLRAYVAQKEKFPEELAKAFKPIYDHQDFAVLVLSFLTGVQQSLYKKEPQQ